MLIEKIKRGETIIRREYPKPRWVGCAKMIVNLTSIDKIVFPIIDSIDTFVAFSREEFHRLFISNLKANWERTFPSIRLRS